MQKKNSSRIGRKIWAPLGKKKKYIVENVKSKKHKAESEGWYKGVSN